MATGTRGAVRRCSPTRVRRRPLRHLSDALSHGPRHRCVANFSRDATRVSRRRSAVHRVHVASALGPLRRDHIFMAQSLALGGAAPLAAQLPHSSRCRCPAVGAPSSVRRSRATWRSPSAVLAEPPPLPEQPTRLSPIDNWLDAARPNAKPKRLQTQVASVAPNTTVIRSLDFDRCARVLCLHAVHTPLCALAVTPASPRVPASPGRR